MTSQADLPLQVGFYNGDRALYITPEVGVDSVNGAQFVATAQTTAVGFNSNYVPTAFAQLPNSTAVDNIYVFTNFTQGNVLSSAPIPAGPTNTNAGYSPLWQVNLVSWNANSRSRPRQLTSQAEIQQASTLGEVTITPSLITVECSVIFTPQGGVLPGTTILPGVPNRDGFLGSLF